jgi:hypothetical protein
VGDFGFRTESCDVEREGEAFERAAKVEQRGTKDAGEAGFRMLEALGAARYAVEPILLLMGGGEDRTLAPEEIDVAGVPELGVVIIEHELEAKGFDGLGVVVSGECPSVALGGEKGRSRGVE